MMQQSHLVKLSREVSLNPLEKDVMLQVGTKNQVTGLKHMRLLGLSIYLCGMRLATQ